MKYLIAGLVLIALSFLVASLMSDAASHTLDPNPIAALMSLIGVGFTIRGLVKIVMSRV